MEYLTNKIHDAVNEKKFKADEIQFYSLIRKPLSFLIRVLKVLNFGEKKTIY